MAGIVVGHLYKGEMRKFNIDIWEEKCYNFSYWFTVLLWREIYTLLYFSCLKQKIYITQSFFPEFFIKDKVPRMCVSSVCAVGEL